MISELYGLFKWTRSVQRLQQRRQLFENLLSFVVETLRQVVNGAVHYKKGKMHRVVKAGEYNLPRKLV